MASRLRLLIVAVALTIGAIILYTTFGTSGPPADSGPQAVAVEAAPVTITDIRDVRSFPGTLRPAAQFVVTATSGGVLEQLLVDIGDRVENGQVIALLNDDQIRQEVARIEAELAVAQARLEEARSARQVSQRDLARVKQLRDRGIASDAEYDAALTRANADKARLAMSEAQVKQARAALNSAKLRLDDTKVRVEWRGDDASRIIAQRFVTEGSTLRPNEPVASVISADRLVAEVTVTERDYARINRGDTARIVAEALPGQRFTGTVTRVSPQFNEFSRQAEVELEVDNRDGRLKPGLYVTARFTFETAENAVTVPVEALVQRDDAEGVFTVVPGEPLPTARFVEVETGLREGSMVQIVSPELSGRVVTLGQHLLETGTPLRITDVAQSRD